jgi:hypothetical protein
MRDGDVDAGRPTEDFELLVRSDNRGGRPRAVLRALHHGPILRPSTTVLNGCSQEGSAFTLARQ